MYIYICSCILFMRKGLWFEGYCRQRVLKRFTDPDYLPSENGIVSLLDLFLCVDRSIDRSIDR